MDLTGAFIKRLMRLVLVDGKASTDGIRQALGMFERRFNLLGLKIELVMLQETTDRINKLERQSRYFFVLTLEAE